MSCLQSTQQCYETIFATLIDKIKHIIFTIFAIYVSSDIVYVKHDGITHVQVVPKLFCNKNQLDALFILSLFRQ